MFWTFILYNLFFILYIIYIYIYNSYPYSIKHDLIDKAEKTCVIITWRVI